MERAFPACRFARAPRSRRLGALEELEPRVVPTLVGNQLFPSDNPWNQVIASAPVAANSAALVASIGAGAGVHADFGSGLYAGAEIGIPYNVVPGNQPKVSVIIDAYPAESDLQSIPIPAGAVIEGDPLASGQNTGDRHLLVYDRDNNKVYELFNAHRPLEEPDGQWHGDSEAVWDLSRDSFRPPTWTSADAAGLPILPGLVRDDEVLDQGVINHALRFTVPQTRNTYVYPASHEAGSSNASLPRMGERFRLRQNFDLSGFSAADRVILQALKTYGMIVADNGSSWFLSGAPSSRWDNNDLHNLGKVRGSDFEAVDLTPVVTGVTAGASTVTITGLDFSGGAGMMRVSFGSMPSPLITVLSDNQILATVPAHGSGTVDVTVLSPYGTSAIGPADRYTFGPVGPPPPAGSGSVLAAAGNGSATVLFALTPGNSLFLHDDATGWAKLGDNIQAITAATESGGMPVVFAITLDRALFRFDRASGWRLLGAPSTIRSASAGTDVHGRAATFVLTAAGDLTEWSTSAGWLPSPIGGRGSVLSMTAVDRDRVVVVTADHSLYQFDPRLGWFPLTGAGFAQSGSAAKDNLGNLVVFAVTLDHGLFRHDVAAGWSRLGNPGSILSAGAGIDPSGLANVFAVTTDGSLAENVPSSAWAMLNAPGLVSETAPDTFGRVFVTLADGSVFGHDNRFGWSRLTSPGFGHQ